MERFHDPLLKETLYTERLENGLTIAVLQKPGFKQATGHLAIHYGSIDSRFVDPATGEPVHVPDGIAHFLEHKLFEEEWGNVADRFSELGADSNAYTTYTHTVYYFSTTQNFGPSLSLLLDYVQSPWFTDESVTKEQGIIDQEIRMYLDDPGWRSNANLVEALYAAHPVRIDIAGTVDSIRKIDKETLHLCHRVFYHPSNMVVFVAGDVDPEQVVAMTRESFAKHDYVPQAAISRLLPEEPSGIAEKRRTERLVVNQPIFRLGFKDQITGLRGRQLLERELLTGAILDAVAGRGSGLYTSLYETGLIDHRFGTEYSPEESYGFSVFAGPTRDPGELEVRLMAGLHQAVLDGIDAADFERAKRKLIGRLVGLMNDLDSIAYVFIDGFFKEVSLFDAIPVAHSMTLEAANLRLTEHFDPQMAAVSIIYPK
jgi:predicted Zn-dependent peptidase